MNNTSDSYKQLNRNQQIWLEISKRLQTHYENQRRRNPSIFFESKL